MPTEHIRTFVNRTLKQRNLIERPTLQKSHIKPILSGFQQGVRCVQISYVYWLQFQTRVRKDVTEVVEEPTSYFLLTDNNCYATRVIVILFTFNEGL